MRWLTNQQPQLGGVSISLVLVEIVLGLCGRSISQLYSFCHSLPVVQAPEH